MPGRLSRCFTGRWNENRFREAKVERAVAVWRLHETEVENRGRSGGRFRFRDLGQQSASLESRRRLRVGRCVSKCGEEPQRASLLRCRCHAYNSAIDFGEPRYSRPYIEVAEFFRRSRFDRCASLVR
jgi:hypothetical protein